MSTLIRPTKLVSPCTDKGCTGTVSHMGSYYPCGAHQDYRKFLKLCRHFKVDPKTLLSLSVPEAHVIMYKDAGGFLFVKPSEMTDLMVNGFEFIPEDIYYKRDESFIENNPQLDSQPEHVEDDLVPVLVEGINIAPVGEPIIPAPFVEDIPATTSVDIVDETGLSLLDRIIAGKSIVPELPVEVDFTKAEIEAKIDSDPKYLDHAFHLLGKDEDNKSPRTRFYRFVTGDYSDEGKNYKPKSLFHEKSERCFKKFCQEDQSVLELAREIAITHWKLLGELLTANCFKLATTDDVWLQGAVILNMTAKALQVKGYGWLPKSKCKFVKGKLVIPGWLAESIKQKQATKNK